MASRCGGPSMALKQWAWDTAAQKLDNSGDEGARLGQKKMREVARLG